MRLYLDDDSADAVLADRLRKEGHEVEVPVDAGMAEKPDPVHLTYAIGEERAFLTKNYRDFEYLHNLILKAQGHHPGILVVRQDNDPKRDLTAAGIVKAINKLLAAKVPVEDGYHVLNHWR